MAQDLTKAGNLILLDLINDNNPSPPNGAFSTTNVSLGAPSAGTGGKNSAVLLTAQAGHGYTGTVTVDYNRLAIDTDVGAILEPSGVSIVDGSTPFATVAACLPAINSLLGINLATGDISNGATAISGTYPKSASLTLAATAFAYTGTLNFTITEPQVDLATAVTTTQLNGLTPPSAG